MHYDGNGNAIRDTNWQADAANNVPISAPEMDTEFNGVATCLSTAMTRNGQSPATANIPFGGNKATGLAVGTAATDAATVSQAQAAIVGKNWITNPSFRFWQRAAYTGSAAVAGTIAGSYIPDRWFCRRDGVVSNYTLTQVLPASNTIPSGNAVKIQRNNGTSDAADIFVVQSLDLSDVQAMVGSGARFALTAYIKKGANFAANCELACYYNTATARAQGIITSPWLALAGSDFPAANLTTGFVRYTAFIGQVVLAGTLSLAVSIRLHGFSGTAGADDSVTIGALKLEIIDASLYQTFTGSPYTEPEIALELLKCQRYYYKTFPQATAPAQSAGNAGAYAYRAQVASTTAGHLAQIPLPVPLQNVGGTVTITTYNPGAANANWRNTTGAADSGVPTVTASTERMLEIQNPQVAGDAASNVIRIHATVDNEF